MWLKGLKLREENEDKRSNGEDVREEILRSEYIQTEKLNSKDKPETAQMLFDEKLLKELQKSSICSSIVKTISQF